MSSASFEHIRRTALKLCNAADRGGVRFIGPKRRRYSSKVTIENAEGMDMGEFCARIKPSVVFLRLTTGADLSTASRLDVYVPGGLAAYAGSLSRAMYAISAGALGLAMTILLQRA